MSTASHTASSYWLNWFRLIIALPLMLLAYVFQGMAPNSSVWLAPALTGCFILVQAFWLRGVSFDATHLYARGLLVNKNFPLDAVVGLRYWPLVNHARIQVYDRGRVRSIWLTPNHSYLPIGLFGNWGRRNLAFPELKSLLEQRIPANRQRAGLD
jgi:hypothetical protein